MAEKTTGLYVRMNPEKKEKARKRRTFTTTIPTWAMAWWNP